MMKLCTNRKRAVTMAKARARRTGGKASIWKCGPCFKVTGEAARAPARCRWVGWALPSLRR